MKWGRRKEEEGRGGEKEKETKERRKEGGRRGKRVGGKDLYFTWRLCSSSFPPSKKKRSTHTHVTYAKHVKYYSYVERFNRVTILVVYPTENIVYKKLPCGTADTRHLTFRGCTPKRYSSLSVFPTENIICTEFRKIALRYSASSKRSGWRTTKGLFSDPFFLEILGGGAASKAHGPTGRSSCLKEAR